MDIYRSPSGTEDERRGDGVPPHSGVHRESDFMADGWRVFKIMAEFVSGFEMMSDAGPAVTFSVLQGCMPEARSTFLLKNLAVSLLRKGFQ